MHRTAVAAVPLFLAARLTAGSLDVANRNFRALGRHARRRGMTADQAATAWHLGPATARDLLAGRDFAELRTDQ